MGRAVGGAAANPTLAISKKYTEKAIDCWIEKYENDHGEDIDHF